MPVEIKELVIKAVVNEDARSGSDEGSAGQQEGPEKIIQACVERVLEILKDKKER